MNALVRKLEVFAPLSAGEREAVAAATAARRPVRAREDVVREGEPPRAVNVVLAGFACRYRTLEDGRRQNLAVLMPGDVCDLRSFVLEAMDHSVDALTDAEVATLAPPVLERLMESSPRLRRALWWSQLVDEAVTREWVVNVGARSALERTAHLFCELFRRQRAVGLARGNSCELPLTQTDLGDCLGLTPVHVNRMIQELRREGLIVLGHRELTIPDLDALEALAQFSPVYLHLPAIMESPRAARA